MSTLHDIGGSSALRAFCGTDWETAFAKGYTIEVSDLGCTRHDDMCQVR
jgi:hypothetical protein